jgi:glycosyltransferase involved in cell wall biosynthesis
MRTLIVIPSRNEAENIASVINEVRFYHPGVELLVVDDGSTDQTAQIAESLNVKALRLPFNLGYGAAVQAGLLYAVERNFDACVLIDGDGQMDPRSISALIEQIENHNVDLALGSRFLGRADYSISWGRRLGISLFRRIASFITRQQITDPTSGFQAIGRRLMGFFSKDNYPMDYPDADTIIRLYFAGFKIKEVPVTIRPRLSGRSMHNRLSAFYYVYKMLFSIFIALTQKRMLASGGSHALSNKDTDCRNEPAGVADDHKPRSTQAAR